MPKGESGFSNFGRPSHPNKSPKRDLSQPKPQFSAAIYGPQKLFANVGKDRIFKDTAESNPNWRESTVDRSSPAAKGQESGQPRRDHSNIAGVPSSRGIEGVDTSGNVCDQILDPHLSSPEERLPQSESDYRSQACQQMLHNEPPQTGDLEICDRHFARSHVNLGDKTGHEKLVPQSGRASEKSQVDCTKGTKSKQCHLRGITVSYGPIISANQ